jgi:hypothetical protein
MIIDRKFPFKEAGQAYEYPWSGIPAGESRAACTDRLCRIEPGHLYTVRFLDATLDPTLIVLQAYSLHWPNIAG